MLFVTDTDTVRKDVFDFRSNAFTDWLLSHNADGRPAHARGAPTSHFPFPLFTYIYRRSKIFASSLVYKRLLSEKIVFFLILSGLLNCGPGAAAIVRPNMHASGSIGLWLKFEVLFSLPFRFRFISILADDWDLAGASETSAVKLPVITLH